MRMLLTLTLSGSALALLLLALRYVFLKRMPSTVYYYAWLLVLLRFALPLPGLIPAPAAAPAAAPAVRAEAGPAPAVQDLAAPAPFNLTERSPALPEAEEEAATNPTPIAEKHYVNLKSPALWLSVWAAGTALTFLFTVLSYALFSVRVRRSLSRATREDLRVYARFPGPKPRLCRCAAYETPLMFGVLRPLITLPERAYDEALLTNVLRHELMHYHRRDPLYKWFAVLVLSAQWFNPLAWLIRRELNRACELSCDELLLRRMNRAEKRSYGNTLLTMAASGALPAGVVATTFSTDKKHLKERLEQIMNYQTNGTRVLAAMLTLALLLGFGLIAGAAPSRTPGTAKTVKVSTVDEFLAAIAPDTDIELKPGTYDFTTASNYGQDSGSPYYSWNAVYDDGAELEIHGVENLSIHGYGKDGTVLAAVPRYANVLKFTSCKNVTLADLTAGHTTEPGFCMGGVLYFEKTDNARVESSGLYGCGTVGVLANDCAGLSVWNCDIYECSLSAVSVQRCREVRVEDCSIHNHGTREGMGAASSLLDAHYTEGFVVSRCRIYDNAANSLLRVNSTKNAAFLSNDVTGNRLEYAFLMEQYAPVVDGCRFEGNDIRLWLHDHELSPVDAEGNRLDEPAQFGEMVLRELDPDVIVTPVPAAKATELEKGGSIVVTNVDELLAAIGPDRTILLDGALFDLSTASNYGGSGTAYYFWRENYDGPELVVHDLSGLTVRPVEIGKDAATISAVPRYANVLSLRNCEDVILLSLTLGHTKEPGVCSGGVLNLESCGNITVDTCRLYGCGILGLQTAECWDLTVKDTEIYECSQGAGNFYRTDGITFENCDVHDVPSPAFHFTECGDKLWNGAPIDGLNDEYDVDASGALTPVHFEPFFPTVEAGVYGPFANDPPVPFEEGSQTLAFARAVQKDFAERNWPSLAEKLTDPFQVITLEGRFMVTPEELLEAAEDFFTPEFCALIADAELTGTRASLFGSIFADDRLAFGYFPAYGEEPSFDDLRLTCLSTDGPIIPPAA